MTPDIEIEMDPKAVADGHDPQLERAVSIAQQQLKEHAVPEPVRPEFPQLSTDVTPGGGDCEWGISLGIQAWQLAADSTASFAAVIERK